MVQYLPTFTLLGIMPSTKSSVPLYKMVATHYGNNENKENILFLLIIVKYNQIIILPITNTYCANFCVGFGLVYLYRYKHDSQ